MNFEKVQLFLSFSDLDTRANHTHKIVHMCDLQHACCFAHKKDCCYTPRGHVVQEIRRKLNHSTEICLSKRLLQIILLKFQ